ncbi:coat protein [Neofusicoccum parvum victorivirus 3]|uniref:Coat protein n=1 Tax=Neofusicoccum parvum victorivirus 3 TaxID=2880267 RepID=A0AAE9BYX9_9VIRU|nr:coat protein [Neofusicoccum parvum victorivirus 3]
MEEHALRNAFLASIISAPRGTKLVGRAVKARGAGKKGKDKAGDPSAGTPATEPPPAPPRIPTSFRKYRSNIRTDSTIAGRVDTRVAQVQYEIGPRYHSAAELFRPLPEEVVKLDASYPMSTALSEDFVGLARKYSNFSATFQFGSLAALVERVAKTLAAATVFEEPFDTDTIRGGEPLFVSALGTLDGPVNSLAGTIFIPRLVDSVLTPNVFAVLINAAAGEGSRVVTDILEIDVTTRRAILPVLSSDDIATPCVEALRVLGANMIACDQGPLFALALLRGLNAALSLVGHTDEGGIFRDLFRVSGFDSPYGGIHYGLEPYSGIPALSTNNVKDASCYVDGLLVAGAALVAHCDPGQEYGGNWFPTILQGTSADVAEVRPGNNQVGTEDMARRNKHLLANAVPQFAEHYSRGLGRLFAAEGSSRLVSTTMSACARLLDNNCRHLRHPSVAPFFWVEPTGLLPPDFVGTPAEENSCGSLAFRGATRTRQAWDDIVRVGEEDPTFTSYAVSLRFARSSWFLAHWLGHPANGLGAIQVRQLDPNGVIHPGPCPDNQEVRDRVEAALPLTSYLWTRGQSPFPAPGEFLNLGGTIGLLVRHLTMDDDGIPTEEHVPTAREFLDTTVSVSAGRLLGLPNGQHNAYDSDARRARTRATRELAAASARARLYGVVGVGEMPILTTAPVLRARAPPPPRTDHPDSGGNGRTLLGPHTGLGRPQQVPDRETRGDPKTTTEMHGAVTGPPLPPQRAVNPPGGGGNPPPPPPSDTSSGGGPPLPVNPQPAGPAQHDGPHNV